MADIGLTGYDMIAETVTGGTPAPVIWSLAPARTSYVCVLAPQRRTRVTRIYTEYPHLTQAWLRRSRLFGRADIVTLHGSIEGVVALDDQSAGVLLVTSGETAQANGLDMCLPLVATDLCLVAYRQALEEVAESSILGRLDLDTLPILELPEFCRVSALHGPLLHRLAQAGTGACPPPDW